MKLLISGGNGFLGSHFIRGALLQGFEVTVIDDMSTMQTNNLSKDVTLIKGKIEEFKTDEKFDYVLHFAARPSPEDYIIHPVDTILSNSIGTTSPDISVDFSSFHVASTQSSMYKKLLVWFPSPNTGKSSPFKALRINRGITLP